MNTVTLSSKYQAVIPKEVRETIGLKAGVSFEVIAYFNRIELIPIKPMKKLKGILKGIDTIIPSVVLYEVFKKLDIRQPCQPGIVNRAEKAMPDTIRAGSFPLKPNFFFASPRTSSVVFRPT